MCTVSFIPIGQGYYVLTSNRDEYLVRPTLPIASYRIGSVFVYYPKDKQAGGTWVAAADNGMICCLLNGAIRPFVPKPHNPKSRGKLVLELFTHHSVTEFVCKCDVSSVEPFTMVLLEVNKGVKLYKFRWNGEKKEFYQLNTSRPFVWSSEMYEPEVIALREQWFYKYLKNSKGIRSADILNFHGSNQGADPANDLIMQRSNGIQTVSITQLLIAPNRFNMQYRDLHKGQNSFISQVVKSSHSSETS